VTSDRSPDERRAPAAGEKPSVWLAPSERTDYAPFGGLSAHRLSRRVDDGGRSWDCPCHGSRFEYDGSVVHAPAIDDLEQYDEDELTFREVTPE
jgi:phenylpropionate dioxygenase-like ring-hydroxylating dioxygenase large terminal subunit